jgi:hypothetical protein
VRRPLIVLGGVVLAVVLFFALRPDDDEPASTASPPTQPTTVETTVTTRDAARPHIRRVVIRIAVRNGRVAGGPRVFRVAQNRRVTIVVTANVSDHVHLHGYDLMRDVAPGRPARIAFRARIPGRFEIELEDRKLPLGQLEVRP